jgi:uncharacterized protein YdhG (YjbR/CyaY superfamily)
MSETKKAVKRTAGDEPAEGFTDIERAAIKERAQELRAAKRRTGRSSKTNAAEEEAAQLAKIAEMPEPDRGMAERIQELVKANAPDLTPKLWYGMPGFAKDGKVICFFQSAQKFKTRYGTLGFNEGASLDDGDMWPNAFALTKMTAAVEKRIGALVKQAAG